MPGDVISNTAFWAFVTGCIGIVAGVLGGLARGRAERDRLEAALAEAYQALGDPEGTERRTAENLRAALDEPYDQDRDAS